MDEREGLQALVERLTRYRSDPAAFFHDAYGTLMRGSHFHQRIQVVVDDPRIFGRSGWWYVRVG